jgi:hypothetical protein
VELCSIYIYIYLCSLKDSNQYTSTKKMSYTTFQNNSLAFHSLNDLHGVKIKGVVFLTQVLIIVQLKKIYIAIALHQISFSDYSPKKNVVHLGKDCGVEVCMLPIHCLSIWFANIVVLLEPLEYSKIWRGRVAILIS